jgi:hypothetical protein
MNEDRNEHVGSDMRAVGSIISQNDNEGSARVIPEMC